VTGLMTWHKATIADIQAPSHLRWHFISCILITYRHLLWLYTRSL